MQNVHYEFSEIKIVGKIIRSMNYHLLFFRSRTEESIYTNPPIDYDLSPALAKLKELGVEFSYDSKQGQDDTLTFTGSYSLNLLADLGLLFPSSVHYGTDALPTYARSL